MNPLKLYTYFGLVGITSIICWAAALWMAYRYRRHEQRTKKYFAALLIALAGFYFSKVNSENVSSIRVDRREEMEKAQQAKRKQQELEQKAAEDEKAEAEKEGKKEFSDLTVKEEELGADMKPETKLDASPPEKSKTPQESATAGTITTEKETESQGAADEPAPKSGSGSEDKTGTISDTGEDENEDEGENIYEKATREGTDYDYRKAGKKKRAEGKQDKDSAIESTVKKEEKFAGKLLPEPDKLMADKLDIWNLFAARWILVLAITLVVWDYLTRFNTTFNTVMPLPIGGPWLDRLYPKNHVVILPWAPLNALRNFLQTIISKGETFIYFGNQNPCLKDRMLRLYVDLEDGEKDGASLQNQPEESFLDTWLKKSARALKRVAVISAAGVKHLAAFCRTIPSRLPEWIRLKRIRSRNPKLTEHLELLGLLLKRIGHRVLVRLPFVVMALLILMIPIPLFFRSNEDALLYYILFLFAAPIPIIVFDTPLLDLSVRRLSFDRSNPPTSSDFVFESAWFSRYCFTIRDESLARELLLDLKVFLNARRIPYATAFRTVNILWDFNSAPDEEVLEELAALARKSNFRLLVVSPNLKAGKRSEVFDEVREEPLTVL